MTEQNLPTEHHEHEAMIDWSILEMLRSLRKKDGPDPGTKLINIFISSSPALLNSMQAAIQAASPESLANAAHSMKSGSLNMGATGLGELCAKLEQIGRSGTMNEAEDLLAKINREYVAVVAAFEKKLTEN
ncbi:MAG: Hpt domain-containing protein [Deltaproteobacteria bacterium]|nr:Hpt domain-containing protein [Deltaproteobacteria bacterium]TLN03694.1 MAG: Hpt domain-containing protein [bacterium]